MVKVPYQLTKEFREEAAERLCLPKSTLETWVRAVRKGKPGNIGNGPVPLPSMSAKGNCYDNAP